MDQANTRRRPGGERSETHKKALAIARKCGAAAPFKDRGVHGTPLVYDQATYDTPANARARREGSRLATLGDEYILAVVPETPPMDARLPNGRRLLINRVTEKCEELALR